MLNKFKKNQGQSLIEVLVAIGVFAIFGFAVAGLALDSYVTTRRGEEETKAAAVAEEGINAARSIIKAAFNDLPVGGPYGLDKSGGYWQLSGSSDSVDQFTRTVTVEEVYRNSGGNIVSSGGTLDLHTKKIISEAEWDFAPGRTQNVILSAYFSNWEGRRWTQTDWSGGSGQAVWSDSTRYFADNGFVDTSTAGELKIAALGAANPTWQCAAGPFTYDLPGNDDAMAVDASGDYVYIGQGSDFYALDASDEENPNITDSLSVAGNITSIFIDGNYAYLATEDNSEELVIIDISDPSDLSQLGSYNTSSGANGRDVYVSGNRAYLVTENNGGGPEFYIIDISNKTSPTLANPSSDYDTGGSTHGVSISGNYAFVVKEGDIEFLVLDISNEASISEASSINLSGWRLVTDVEVSGNYAYFTTGWWYGRVYSIDISDPTNVSIADYIQYSGTDFNRLDVGGDFAYLAAEKWDEEVVFLDISDPTNLTHYDSYDYPSAVNDVAAEGFNLFVASDDDSAELGIFTSKESSSWYCLDTVGTIDMGGSGDALGVLVREEGSDTIAYINRDWEGGELRLYSYDVSTPASPVELDYFSNAWHAIGGFAVSGNYAYLATANDSKELTVVDVSDPSVMSEAGSYDADSGSDANDFYVSGNRAYLVTDRNPGGSDPEFYILDITDPTNPVLAAANSDYDLNQNINSVWVSGNYAYLATADNSKEFLVLDISDENNIIEADSYDTSGNNDGRDIFVSGGYAYMTTGNGDNLYVFDVSNPSSVSLSGIYSAGDDTAGVFVEGDYAFMASYEGQKEFQIINIADPTNPFLMNSYDNNYQYGYDTYKLNDYVYFANADDAGEIKIFKQKTITGGGGGGAYYTSAELESSAFQAGAQSNFNIIEWSESLPGGNFEIQFQIKTAPDSSGSPGAWSATWCGPEGEDGDSDDYFTNAAGEYISTDHNGDQWIKYKVFLSGDGTNTPVLEDITIDYTPW